MRDYQVELGIDLCFQDFEAELAGLPGRYRHPTGELLVGLVDGRAVAVGGFRQLDDPTVVEIKRMYVEPTHRGAGEGRRLLEELIGRAREVGCRTVLLDTLARLEPAVALYRKVGFREIPAYNVNPEEDILYFSLEL